MLHETAVSWIRVREQRTRPTKAWEEMPAQLGDRLRKICKDINDNLDVAGLCRKLPDRLDKLGKSEGDRIGN